MQKKLKDVSLKFYSNFIDDKDIDDLSAKVNALFSAKPGEAPVIQKIESPKIDMQHLYELFAAKAPPDNTINRIIALEKLVKEQGQRLDGADTEGLHKRMAAVEEKVNKNHEMRITTLE